MPACRSATFLSIQRQKQPVPQNTHLFAHLPAALFHDQHQLWAEAPMILKTTRGEDGSCILYSVICRRLLEVPARACFAAGPHGGGICLRRVAAAHGPQTAAGAPLGPGPASHCGLHGRGLVRDALVPEPVLRHAPGARPRGARVSRAPPATAGGFGNGNMAP